MIWEAHCHLAAYPQTATLPLSCVQGSEETPNECALLTWAWPCQSLKPMQTLESLLQAFLQGVHMNTDNVCRKCPTPLSTLDVCSLKTAPLQNPLLRRVPKPCSAVLCTIQLPPSAVYNNPLPCQLCVVIALPPCSTVLSSPPPCSTVYNNPASLFSCVIALPPCSTIHSKHADLPGYFGPSIREES